MARGGARPNSGPKRRTVEIPVSALSLVPTQGRTALLDENELVAQLNKLVLAGNPFALKLALEQREREAKVELIKEQTRNYQLRNKALEGDTDQSSPAVIIVPEKRAGVSWQERAQEIRDEQQELLRAKLGNE